MKQTKIISIEDVRKDFQQRGVTKEKATENMLANNLPEDKDAVLKIIEEIFNPPNMRGDHNFFAHQLE